MSRRDDIAPLIAQGLTTPEIAGALGITRQAVQHSLGRYGLRPLTRAEATLARIRACAAERLTLAASAARLGLSPQHVSKVAKGNGIRFVNSNNSALLRSLSPQQRADYWRCIAKRFPAAEALAIVEPRA